MLKKVLLGLTLLLTLTTPALAKKGQLTFTQMDLNKNGAVELKEMQTMISQRMKKVDKDNNKIITVQEVLNMMPIYVRPMARGKVTEFLKKQDLNKNGQTHLSEMQTLAQRKFKAHDKNKDGKLSKVEFKAMQKTR